MHSPSAAPKGAVGSHSRGRPLSVAESALLTIVAIMLMVAPVAVVTGRRLSTLRHDVRRLQGQVDGLQPAQGTSTPPVTFHNLLVGRKPVLYQ